MKSRNTSKRIWLFRTIAISISLLLVVLIEIVLRLVGYGHNYELFVESKTYPGYYVMNEYASEKFFMNEDKATVGYYEPFKINKTKDSYRIFVLGESTTVGFPYGYNGSFHRWLKYRLMFTFPGINFEIINLSLTAVNSYTIADFAEQIVDYEPDAVLIYVGHNEFYGALGVGSNLKTGNNPKVVRQILKLRRLRLYQLLHRIIQRVGKASNSKQISEKSLMQYMPGDTQIAFESEKYKRAIQQFNYNMKRTCKTLSAKNIPLLISNVVSNEKDLKPFISESNPETSAAVFFDKAREAYKNENFSEAKQLFVKAKEYDLLRFRAPEAINTEIENLSKSFDQVKLVDFKARMEQESPHGIIGNETLLEHVHPNLFGYALLSDAFFIRMKELKLVDSNWNGAMSFEQLLKDMPVNEVDSLRGAYQIRFMLNEWPFRNNPVPGKDLIVPVTEFEKNVLKLTVGETTWDVVQGNLYESKLKSGELHGALKISEAMALINPMDDKWLKNTATLSVNLRNKPKAAFYFTKAFDLNKTIPGAQQLGKIYTEMDEPEQAIKYYNYLLSGDKQNKIYPVIINMLSEILKEKATLSAHNDDIAVLNKLAWDYLQLRSTEAAGKYLTRSLSIDPKNSETIQISEILTQVEKEKELKK